MIEIITLIIGIIGLIFCIWLYRWGWSSRRPVKMVDRDIVIKASKKK